MLPPPDMPSLTQALLSLLMGKDIGVLHLVGHKDYTATYITSNCKVQAWCGKVKYLAETTNIFPHAAFAAFTHGLFGCWSYLMQTILDIKRFLTAPRGCHSSILYSIIVWSPPCLPTERDLNVCASSSLAWLWFH